MLFILAVLVLEKRRPPELSGYALKGLGMVQLPDYYVAAHLQSGALMSVLDNKREPDEGIWAVYPSNRHLSAKVRVLIEFFAEQLKERR